MRYAPALKWTFTTVTAVVAAFGIGLVAQSEQQENSYAKDQRMSAMGKAAARERHRVETSVDLSADEAPVFKDLPDDECHNEPGCPAGLREGPRDTQSEVSIAVDSTGQHVVIGYNDFRGFLSSPISLSGIMYSDDGGQTFVDGGQLPSPGTDLIGTTRLPQIFGDPEVEYIGSCTFIYSSIMIKKFSATRTVQTMSVHRSTDCGHTWQGPFEVTAATNPNGQVNPSTGAPLDAADKEFMSVDRETGRVIMSWSNFTPFSLGGVEIATTYSDDILATPPTWSARKIVAATDVDGQGSNPAFAAGSSNAYVAWARFPFPGTFFGFGNTIGFSRSTDNGQTWSTPIDLTGEFLTIDHILGNDRVHTFPGIAVDNSAGAHAGNVYVVYANNDSEDGSDVVLQRSTDAGLTFSSPLRLNSRPGDDRSQWFPWVAVDSSSGRVHVFYYDQGIAASGDMMEVMHTYSDDGGINWLAPLPISNRPFHAGWGNTTGQPNLGDYNQIVAQNGELFAAFAETSRPPLGFADGQPMTSLTVPDVVFRRYTPAVDLEDGDGIKPATLDLQAVTFTESGGNGFLDPGDTARFQITLRNYVTNPLNARRVVGIQAVLSTTTPGVAITAAHSPYDSIVPGASGVNKRDFQVTLLPGFVAGTLIEFQLDIHSADFGTASLRHTQFTGTPVPTTILTQDFDGVAPGTLPAGWQAAHGAGAVVVPWTTRNTFCGTSNGAFHSNDNIGASSAQRVRWERLFSPSFSVPADTEYLIVEFDVCYDSEEEPNFNILAYDGFFLRLLDATPGRTLRSVLAEAFADEFTTGPLLHYPRHFPRSSNSNYFEDMSAWSGLSNGIEHVRMRLPGVAGSVMQLRFEYTQDPFGTCQDVRPASPACGVFVDNVVVRSVKSQTP
jgi:hypothetical protein